jgi:hypothetical protein
MSAEDSKENLTDLISEISALREELASQQTEIKGLRAKVRLLEAEPSRAAQSQTLGSQLAAATTSRRNLLKLSGAAAGLAVLSGLSMAANQPHVILAGDDTKPPAPPIPPPNKGPKPPQTSVTGDALRLGIASQAASNQDQTRMYNSSGSILSPILFRADNYTNVSLSLPTSARVGIAGTSSGTDNVNSTRVGVYGSADTNGYGVWGNHEGNGVGVYASAGNNGTALWAVGSGTAEAGIFTATGDNTIEVYNSSTGGDGTNAVYASSSNGYGVYAYGGQAALCLSSTGADPRTLSNAHSVGELYKDNTGNLWYCTVSGTPGTWRKVGGSITAGSFHPLTKPSRFIDTRPAPTGINDVNHPYLNGSSRSYNMTTLIGRGGATIPTGATGVYGNVTVISNSNGYLQISPGGLTGSDPSTLNFSASIVIANAFFSSLNVSGQMTVQTALYSGGSASATVIIDITGYYL